MRRVLLWLGLIEEPDPEPGPPWYVTLTVTFVCMLAGILLLRSSFFGLLIGMAAGMVINSAIDRRWPTRASNRKG
ncbi:hypothetical protein GCM10009682_57840 [Luedemannella flava]|uniref:Uncharacterized protein n=1 Tax=Luedemannella flava TaxID=349316 RepID=A0ABN2MM57_9ACTN